MGFQYRMITLAFTIYFCVQRLHGASFLIYEDDWRNEKNKIILNLKVL
jgi:hypothetical protein